MKLVPEYSKILTTACDKFDFDQDIDLEKITAEMLKFMFSNGGVGLACPQVDLPYNFFVIYEKPYLIINPDIVDFSDEKTKSKEGCLSFPGLLLPVERSNTILLTYQNIKGEYITERFTDLLAKIIQHETDHLNGITFRQRVSKLTLAMAEKKRQKLLKEIKYE